ncbi:uncharacterized protein LOC103700128 [Phoenix dactylifera]|uniref:Uncharacterized protein LOC103700128 n=1 Tax=Phoenix dactylifera TaxID=42345 RepID=A0A8B8J122_PHODC|nr:uncharacterized protein LOC103700128 [Phoenix dactylifera]
MAGEKECMESHPRQRDQQQISVPFLWEERPGTPKKEWISRPVTVISVPSPARLVVSVPFEWEEKPGTPLQLSQPSPDSSPLRALPGLAGTPSSAHLLNPSIDEEEGVLATSAFKVLASEMNDDESGLAPSTFPSHHVKTCESFADVNDSQGGSTENSSDRQENWYSVSETDCNSSSNSSATHTASFDASAAEFLFPLSFPDAGFLNMVRGRERALIPAAACPELQPTAYSHNRSVRPRRTLTLGELILLSRKLSYKMKPVDVEKRSNLKVFIKKSLLTCFPFSTGINKNNVFISNC